MKYATDSLDITKYGGFQWRYGRRGEEKHPNRLTRIFTSAALYVLSRFYELSTNNGIVLSKIRH
jgi:hypothetical protein